MAVWSKKLMSFQGMVVGIGFVLVLLIGIRI